MKRVSKSLHLQLFSFICLFIVNMPQEKNIKTINNELADMLAALAKTNKCMQQVGAAIEESKGHKASELSATQCLQELNEQLLNIEVEQQTIQKNMQAFDNNDEMLLQMLVHKFNKLNYNLTLSRDEDNLMLYRFDYGPNRFITVRVEYGQLTLVQMSPENPNFFGIKQFFNDSQDLNGLLTSFADFAHDIN